MLTEPKYIFSPPIQQENCLNHLRYPLNIMNQLLSHVSKMALVMYVSFLEEVRKWLLIIFCVLWLTLGTNKGTGWMVESFMEKTGRERERGKRALKVFVFGLGLMFICRMHTHNLKTQIVLNDNPMSQYTSYTAPFVVSSSNHLHISKDANNALFCIDLDIIPHTTSASHLPHICK